MYMKQNPNPKAVVTVCTVNSCLFGHPAIVDTKIIHLHLQILHCPGVGHLPTSGPTQTFDTHAVSYQTINTQRI